MRLICPNCGAQYEVDDSLVPDSGRDVQCSNCGHGWFQRPLHRDAGLAAEMGRAPAEPAQEMPEPKRAAAAQRTPPAAMPDSDAGDEAEEPDEPKAPAPRPPRMQTTIRTILEEEGRREVQARRAATGIETQTDLGLGAEPPARPTPVTPSRPRSEPIVRTPAAARAEPPAVTPPAGIPATVVPVAPGPAARRDLLPDIEEINSSLRSAEERGGMVEADDILEPRRRSGFGLGFLLVVLLAMVLVALYVFADAIAAALPAAEGVLDAYVAWADRVRGWLDGIAQDWVRRITAMVDSIQTGADG